MKDKHFALSLLLLYNHGAAENTHMMQHQGRGNVTWVALKTNKQMHKSMNPRFYRFIFEETETDSSSVSFWFFVEGQSRDHSQGRLHRDQATFKTDRVKWRRWWRKESEVWAAASWVAPTWPKRKETVFHSGGFRASPVVVNDKFHWWTQTGLKYSVGVHLNLSRSFVDQRFSSCSKLWKWIPPPNTAVYSEN